MREIDFDGRRFRTVTEEGQDGVASPVPEKRLFASFAGGFVPLFGIASFFLLIFLGDFMKPVVRALAFVLAVVAAVAYAGQARGVLWFETGSESGSARGVQGAVEELFSADNQNDIDRLAACFEEDAVWLPPTGEVVSGRTAISAWYRARHVRWAPLLSAAVLDLRVDKSRAVVHGAARGALVPACGGAALAIDDRFVMILSKSAKSGWKVARLFWRRGAPAG